MNIVRFNPWRDFDERFAAPAAANRWVPAADIYETDSSFLIELEIPAVSGADLEVAVKDGVLTVSGERTPVERGENDRQHRIERRFGAFSRSFRLSKNVDEDNITAVAKDGVVTLTLAKKVEDGPRRIEVAAA